MGTPFPWRSPSVGNPVFRHNETFLAPRRYLTHHLHETSLVPILPARVPGTATSSWVQKGSGSKRSARGRVLPSSVIEVRAILPLPYGAERSFPEAPTLWPCARCRVRGQVLMAQEHQPLPSEPCWQFSLHTALQESLRRFSSEECMPDQRVSSHHILPDEC